MSQIHNFASTHSTTSSVSVLDLLIPGSTSLLAVVNEVLAGSLNSFLSLLCMVVVFFYLAKRSLNPIWEFTESHFTSTIQVDNSSGARDILASWVSRQEFAKQARSSIARVDKKDVNSSKNGEKTLSYSPWRGTYVFFNDRRLFWLKSTEQDVGFHREELLSISCFGRSPKPLKALLDKCKAEHKKLMHNKTAVFEPHFDSWKEVRAGDVRPISTVIMDEKKKSMLLDHMATYLQQGSPAWYANRGISYKIGCLLYGPPGTGKSSLSLSIAGHFALDIYVLDISCVTSEHLGDLLAALPPRCILLLEDVDAAQSTQTRRSNANRRGRAVRKGGLALSELLNALDGVSSKQGRVLIMTTNHIENLDPALIRPGRADIKIMLPNANRDIIRRIFCKIFNRQDGEVVDPGNICHEQGAVENYARDFAKRIPNLEFSPAEIQSFLVENRASLSLPAENVDDWIMKTRRERGAPNESSNAMPNGSEQVSDTDLDEAPEASLSAADDNLSAGSSNTSLHESADTTTSEGGHLTHIDPNRVSTHSAKLCDQKELITKDEAKSAIRGLLGTDHISKMLGPKPLWAQFDDSDPGQSMASYLQEMLLANIENLPIVA